jgi:hypothetical protein
MRAAAIDVFHPNPPSPNVKIHLISLCFAAQYLSFRCAVSQPQAELSFRPSNLRTLQHWYGQHVHHQRKTSTPMPRLLAAPPAASCSLGPTLLLAVQFPSKEFRQERMGKPKKFARHLINTVKMNDCSLYFLYIAFYIKRQ